MNKAKAKQFLTAAIGVALGLVLYNNVRGVAGNTAVGKLINGDLVRRAG